MTKIMVDFSGWAVNDVIALYNADTDEYVDVSGKTADEILDLLRNGDDEGYTYTLPSLMAFIVNTDDSELTDVDYLNPHDLGGDY